MIDIDEHRQLDHAGDAAQMSGAIADDEYLANVVGRIEQRRKETHEQYASDPAVLGCLSAFGVLIAIVVAVGDYPGGTGGRGRRRDDSLVSF